MRMYDIIHKKRNGGELSEKEIKFFVDGYTDGSIPDYQAAALCMAIYFRGMNADETAALTLAMADSGDRINLSGIDGFTVDKHSTGGVGDKTSLIVAPIVAANGGKVAKMSGRGLGHTGGTVDKLESIPGFRTSLTPDEFINQVNDIGLCIVGQTGELAPADKKLYALRDVTATVESIPLIASSIMSKKLAAGAKTIVLDVKYGSGAFMKTPEDAEALAREMTEIGKGAGRNMCALITNMDVPLGFAVGNALEVKEAVSVLKGTGPEDLTELCTALAAQMYSVSFGEDEETAAEKARAALKSGEAFKRLCLAAGAQGGDEKLLTGEHSFKEAEGKTDVFAEKSGYIVKTDSSLVGKASVTAGAGRETLNDKIDYSAGVVLHRKTGDFVNKGEKIAVMDSVDQNFGEEWLKNIGNVLGGKAPDYIVVLHMEPDHSA
ncbi:MAG TPA: thymidine phosphorylase, partial [Ruminococcaceae bacterium]|nr:thymidine phosphorylase [Oscillospiraceae bacterium]